jgi:thiol-disulfide isomerase/thioredoxin
MRHTSTATWFLLLAALLGPAVSRAELARSRPVNKLLYMYRLYYLPFSVEFEVGRDDNLILPYFPERYPEPARIFTAEELNKLDAEWAGLRQPWTARSLLESTKVPLNGTTRISQRLISHRIPMARTAFDKLSINERIQLKEALSKKAPRVKANFLQLVFLKSFLEPLEEEKFNFFVVGASWCGSSRDYRVLLEAYVKKFANPGLNLHSVVIDDPKGKVFESQILKDLFPNTDKYTHDTIPRFLAYQVVNGETKVWEEGEALRELYDRFFKNERGFMNDKSTLFKNWPGPASRTLAVDPALSSVTK